jgi:hypothetical protein
MVNLSFTFAVQPNFREVHAESSWNASRCVVGRFSQAPQIEVAGSALEINHDHVFGRAPAGAAGALARLAREGLQLEERSERKAQHARAANAQQIPPGHFELRIAKVTACAAGYFDHNFLLSVECWREGMME